MNYALLLYTMTYFLESSAPLHILQREVDLLKINVNRFTFDKVCCYPVFKEIKKMTKISISSPLILLYIYQHTMSNE